MKTELLFFDDCYLKEFDAEVIKSKDDRVILDQTAFYPEGGGQPTDEGWIDFEGESFPVMKVYKKGEVFHQLERNPFSGGETVKGRIDWDVRYSYMRNHTAQHVISAVVSDEYGGITTGNQIYREKARIDFSVERFTKDDLSLIEARFSDFVAKEIPVTISIISREEAFLKLDPKRTRIDLLPPSVTSLRMIDIEGVDLTACGGTHVANLKELCGIEKISTQNKGKGRKRIAFTLKSASI